MATLANLNTTRVICDQNSVFGTKMATLSYLNTKTVFCSQNLALRFKWAHFQMQVLAGRPRDFWLRQVPCLIKVKKFLQEIFNQIWGL